jgi:hypothetical protein
MKASASLSDSSSAQVDYDIQGSDALSYQYGGALFHQFGIQTYSQQFLNFTGYPTTILNEDDSVKVRVTPSRVLFGDYDTVIITPISDAFVFYPSPFVIRAGNDRPPLPFFVGDHQQ